MSQRAIPRPLAVLLVVSSLVAATGCGEDDEGAGGGGQAAPPQAVRIALTGSEKKPRFSVPKSVPGGLARIEFSNRAKGEHAAQLGRVDAGHTAQEGLRAAAAWGEKGRPLPEWVHTAGGVGSTPSGATSSATQELPPGQYFVVDLDSNASAFFEVTGGKGGGQLPTTPARINEAEYTFNAVGLKAGQNQVLIDNRGREPHFVEALRMKPGKTIAEVRRFFRDEKGEPPTEEQGRRSTPVLDGGGRQVVGLDLQKGNYALVCFVPDRKGGPPHVAKGMVSQATVR